MEDRLDTDIDDVWSALTEPERLARWYGEIGGELRVGGAFRARLHASGWEGTGRVEECEPPRRLLVVTKEPDEPNEDSTEVTLTGDGNQTVLVVEQRGLPLDLLWAYGAGLRSTSKISPRTSPGVSATTPRRGSTSSNLSIRTWRPTAASQTLSCASVREYA
jgi:hypothetical protein